MDESPAMAAIRVLKRMVYLSWTITVLAILVALSCMLCMIVHFNEYSLCKASAMFVIFLFVWRCCGALWRRNENV